MDTSTSARRSTGFAFRFGFQAMIALMLLVAMCHNAEVNAKGNAVIVNEEISMAALVEHGIKDIMFGLDTSTWTGRSAGFAFRLNFQAMVALTLLVAMCHDAEVNASGNVVIVNEEN